MGNLQDIIPLQSDRSMVFVTTRQAWDYNGKPSLGEEQLYTHKSNEREIHFITNSFVQHIQIRKKSTSDFLFHGYFKQINLVCLYFPLSFVYFTLGNNNRITEYRASHNTSPLFSLLLIPDIRAVHLKKRRQATSSELQSRNRAFRPV